jgi:arginine utilization regulatory protein
MGSDKTTKLEQPEDIRTIDFVSVLNHLDEGVIITDREGNILYYNETQSQIDGLDAGDVLGKKVTDIYRLSEETSLIMRCLKTGHPMRNRTFFYKTIKGKVVNTIHSVFPIQSNDQVTGTICFVRDYKILKRTTPVLSVPDIRPKRDNRTRYTFADMLGRNRVFVRSVNTAREAANSASPILIIGETGTGKELFAQSIHNHSIRSKKKYVAINCAAIPEHLLEGILFGTVKGAFTGAVDRAGLFEKANNSTLFLDELLAMPLNLQAKLLRVLQEKKVQRIGSAKEIDLKIKIISSINRPPRDAIDAGQLRGDLFYRIGVVMIKIPPLKERMDDIHRLVNHFIALLNTTLGTGVKRVSDEVLDLFENYAWPGNIRELEHLMEGAMNIVGFQETIERQHFSAAFESMDGLKAFQEATYLSPASVRPEPSPLPSFQNKTGVEPEQKPLQPLNHLAREQRVIERTSIEKALTDTGGNITRSSAELGISRQLLHYKMKKYHLSRTDFM